MTLQDFITVWQAQPFRSFRVHSSRGILTVTYPLAVALSPQLKVAVVTDQGRAETFSLDEITRCEAFGETASLEEVINGIDPEILARNAQLLTAAMKSAEPQPAEQLIPGTSRDPGTVSLLGAYLNDGVYCVQASVADREGKPLFSTAGTRWNLHGVEQFENGTSLYLHHPDDPATEERVILWPPDSGTLESFAEAKPLAVLLADLKKRDARLTGKPVKPKEPPASHFRKILREYPRIELDDHDGPFGEDPTHHDFDRFEIHLVPRTLANGVVVQNPCLVDVPAENFLFNLTDTEWDATFERGEDKIGLTLRYTDKSPGVIELVIDPYFLTARVKGDEADLPLGFIEGELRNYELYQKWFPMMAALLAGPDRLKQPNLVLSLAEGFSAELWAGIPQFQLPFLQPRILDASGHTLLDFRATAWAASVVADRAKPGVTLRLLSHEKTNRWAEPRFELQVDLVTHRVTCAGLEGSTSLGMIQAMIRRVRGIKWLGEELPKWMQKGRSLPQP